MHPFPPDFHPKRGIFHRGLLTSKIKHLWVRLVWRKLGFGLLLAALGTVAWLAMSMIPAEVCQIIAIYLALWAA